jgi:hypothetical protein
VEVSSVRIWLVIVAARGFPILHYSDWPECPRDIQSVSTVCSAQSYQKRPTPTSFHVPLHAVLSRYLDTSASHNVENKSWSSARNIPLIPASQTALSSNLELPCRGYVLRVGNTNLTHVNYSLQILHFPTPVVNSVYIFSPCL